MNMNSFYIIINNTSTHMYLSNEKRIPITHTVLLLGWRDFWSSHTTTTSTTRNVHSGKNLTTNTRNEKGSVCGGLWHTQLIHTLLKYFALYFPSYLELCNCVLLLRYLGGRGSISCNSSRRCWKRDLELPVDFELVEGKTRME